MERRGADFIYRFADAEDDYKRMVVEHQEQLRETGYGTDFPNAMDFVIEDTGTSIGRVQIDFSDDVVHVVDIAIIAPAQGKGVGESVLRGVQRAAAVNGTPVLLACAHNNTPAQHLYAKLGFQLHQAGSISNRLIWYPIQDVL